MTGPRVPAGTPDEVSTGISAEGGPASDLDAADHWAEIAREDFEKTRPLADCDDECSFNARALGVLHRGVDRMFSDELRGARHGARLHPDGSVESIEDPPGTRRWAGLPLAILAVLQAAICGSGAAPGHLATLRECLATSSAELAGDLGPEFASALRELLQISREQPA